MKVGDTVKSGKIEGKLLRFQLKTQDLIVADQKGKIHIFLRNYTEVIPENQPDKVRV